MTLATDTWLRCSAPAGIRSQFSSGTKYRRRSQLSSCRTSTTTTSIRLRGWSYRGVRPLLRELVSYHNLKFSKIQWFPFCRGLPVHVPRAVCLRERFNLVRWEGPLSLRLRRVVHPLQPNPPSTSRGFSRRLCAFTRQLLCLLVLHPQVRQSLLKAFLFV